MDDIIPLIFEYLDCDILMSCYGDRMLRKYVDCLYDKCEKQIIDDPKAMAAIMHNNRRVLADYLIEKKYTVHQNYMQVFMLIIQIKHNNKMSLPYDYNRGFYKATIYFIISKLSSYNHIYIFYSNIMWDDVGTFYEACL